MISFFVPGKPQSQGSKIKTQWGMRESNKELGPWRERVALAAHNALEDPDCLLIKGPVVVTLQFVMFRPKGLPKSRPTPPCTKAPDIDKLARGILDALTHVIYSDDAQVTTLIVTKRVAELHESPGVHVWVGEDQNTSSNPWAT